LKTITRQISNPFWGIVVSKGAGPGTYVVKFHFTVTSDGTIKNIVADSNPGYGTKEEAIRFMKTSPIWIPAEKNGKKVSSTVKQTITFQVSEE
jgi:protein TonB